MSKPKKPAPARDNRLNIYLPHQLATDARAYAAAQDRSFSNLIAHLLRTELESSLWRETHKKGRAS